MKPLVRGFQLAFVKIDQTSSSSSVEYNRGHSLPFCHSMLHTAVNLRLRKSDEDTMRKQKSHMWMQLIVDSSDN